jgi:transcriptional regulator with XRE-family HTH domain
LGNRRFCINARLRVANQGRSVEELREIDAVVEHLREFLRLNYMTGAEVARRMGVRDMTVYSWLQGESRPAEPERIIAFLDCLPAEKSGFAPTGYEYRECKNWRGIPKAETLAVLQAGQRRDSGRSEAAFTEFVRIAVRPDQSGKVTMRR